MTWAADAVGHPDPQTLKDTDCAFIGQYVGTAYQRYGTSRGYIDDCLGHGLGVLLILEEWASQFLGGYSIAVQMMDRMHASWDALGAPSDGTVLPAIALVDPNPGAVNGNEGALIEFARGVNDALWVNEFTGYGSKYGLDVVRGSGVAPRLTRRWGVGTWGFGERPDGSLPPNVDADLIQHGNLGAPLPGVDYNTMFRADMGQWAGGQPPAPQPEDDEMRLFHDTTTDLWWLAQSGEMIVCPAGHVWNLAVAGVPHTELPSDTVQWLGVELPIAAPAPPPATVDYARIAKECADATADEIARRAQE